MIHAVIDTNLIVSYLLTQSETTSRLIDHWEQGHFIYVTSPSILNELKEVVYRPRLRQLMRVEPAILVDLIEAEATIIEGKLALHGICRDPKDDHFIACALEGGATYLITGDADLLDLQQYEGIVIMRAYDFVNLLDQTNVSFLS